MNNPDGEPVIRICVSVRSSPFRNLQNPGLGKDTCFRCGEQVWVSLVQQAELQREYAGQELRCLCSDCALADETISSSLEANWVASVVSSRFHGRTHTWRTPDSWPS